MVKHQNNPPYFCFRNTPFGPVALLWSVYGNEPKIRRIFLSQPEMTADETVVKIFPDSRLSSSSDIDAVLDQIEAFLSGKDIRFSLDRLYLDNCSAFLRRVLLAEYAIPWGRVSTYKLLAKHLGNLKGARAVGTALANNPFPVIIPCHRAIRSDGGLGGFQYGLKMKRELLEMEGLDFRDGNHVATQDFFYRD